MPRPPRQHTPPSTCTGAQLALVQADAERLLLLFTTGADEVPVDVPLQPRTAQALRLVYGLYGHTCTSAPEVGVALLQRTVAAIGGAVTRIVVRPGPAPAFWLRVGDRDTWTELPLDVLDAVALLLSRRVPIELVRTDDSTWDGGLARLVEER